jgi:hypothetical protein
MWNFELSWWRWGNFEFLEGIIPLTRHHLAIFPISFVYFSQSGIGNEESGNLSTHC